MKIREDAPTFFPVDLFMEDISYDDFQHSNHPILLINERTMTGRATVSDHTQRTCFLRWIKTVLLDKFPLSIQYPEPSVMKNTSHPLLAHTYTV